MERIAGVSNAEAVRSSMGGRGRGQAGDRRPAARALTRDRARVPYSTHEDRGAARRAGAPRAHRPPPGEASLLLYRPHRDGHPALAQQTSDSQ